MTITDEWAPMTDRDDDEWEDDSGDWTPDDDEPATDECPYCGAEILEDAPRCPYCEQYISGEDAPPARKPKWVIVGAFACLIVAVIWAFGM